MFSTKVFHRAQSRVSRLHQRVSQRHVVVCARRNQKGKAKKKSPVLPKDIRKGFALDGQLKDLVVKLDDISKFQKEQEALEVEKDASHSQKYEQESKFQRVYSRSDYLPPEWTSPAVELVDAGTHTTFIAKEDILPTDLLFVSRPLLHTTDLDPSQLPPSSPLLPLLSSHPSGPQIKRALSTLPCSAPSHTRRPSTPLNLDLSKACSEESVAFPEGVLEELLEQNSYMNVNQDVATTILRKQVPSSFLGVWLPYAQMLHASAPNTTVVVIGDVMIIRATSVISAGDEITVNKIGGYIRCPLSVREAQIRSSGVVASTSCLRTAVEAAAPQAVRDILEELHTSYLQRHEGVGEALEGGDIGKLVALQASLRADLSRLEEEVERATSDPQDSNWLLGSALASYELLLVLSQLTGRSAQPQDIRTALSVLKVMAALIPGSEEHTLTAASVLRTLMPHFTTLQKRQAAIARKLSSHVSDAIIARYGAVNDKLSVKLVNALMTSSTTADEMVGGNVGSVLAGEASSAFADEELSQMFDQDEGEAVDLGDLEDEADELEGELEDDEAVWGEIGRDGEGAQGAEGGAASAAGGAGKGPAVGEDLLKDLEEEQKQMLLL